MSLHHALKPASWPRLWLPLLFLTTLLTATGAVAAAGSWVLQAPAVRVAVPGRQYVSAALVVPEPASLAGRRLVSLSWRYQLPTGRQLQAWLCQDERCIALSAAEGAPDTSGLRLEVPLRFRFALPPGERQAVTVQGLQLILNYR
ncbi:flagellar protein FlhE [Zobellella maritima]|uniref:flagellar protein FlhE n=1 Tax=Zobellella maritima TaxID=2059725 RepID=UPI000E30425A|nr:flagellar protein FlhE [Zobellella maritima]